MIYATMCVGSEWIDRFKKSINEFSKSNELHLLTDDKSDFNDNITLYRYTRDVFSYYEKIKFILDLSKKYEERITYIDSDWISQYNTNLKYDTLSLYTYLSVDISSNKDNELRWVGPFEKKLKNGLLLNQIMDYQIVINKGGNIPYYIAEALISFPYQKNIDELINDSKILQTFLENHYTTVAKTRSRLNRYKNGIGYAEGWGISALCVKYNIDIKEVTEWRKKTLL